MRAKLPYLFLLGIVLLMFVTNYQLGTWLSGWDNLHPEFDFLLNIKRSFFSVWQEYQGLGLLGGMGHGSDLIRQTILWLSSFIVPNSFSRYFFHFLMLLGGAIGIYKLLDYLLMGGDRKKIACLAGGVFYLFNLATLQMFYVPLEVYSSHFAFLPWLFLSNLKFLEIGGRKQFLLLFFINILALSQGYVATYFLVYFMALSLILLAYLIWKKKPALVRIIIAVITVLIINSFWLLPNLYFVATNSEVNLNAKINQMATEDNFLKNQKFGDIKNTALLKGFWFDNVEINNDGVAEYQFKPWINYFNNFPVPAIGYFLFILGLSGMIISVIKRRAKIIIFVPVFLVSFILLSNNTPILSGLGEWFYKIPLFSQIFRYPFTKFAILIAFCLSLFYAVCINELIHCNNKKILKIMLTGLFIILPVIYLFPVFQGNLFYQKERAQIPESYFQLMAYLKTQDRSTRIANFPQSTFWGWNFYRFNYSGSGFLWYGVSQPILDRAFDPWSRENENYYWEASYALYSQNQNLFEKVLNKYQISRILLDENIVSPSSAKSLYVEELKEILVNNPERFSVERQFGNLSLYRYILDNPHSNFVSLVNNPVSVGPDYKWNNFDQAYFDYETYISDTQEVIRDTETYYPFRSLFTGKRQEDIEFKIEETADSLVFKKTIPSSLANYQLFLPQTEKEELLFVDPNDYAKIIPYKPEVSLVGESLTVVIPKIKGLFSAQFNPASENSTLEAKNCNQFSVGEVSNRVISEENLLRLSSLNALNCSQIFYSPILPHNLSYLITVKNRNLSGKSLLFWLENTQSQKGDIETYLPKNPNLTTSYFIQPPMTGDGLGYALHFDNISIGNQKTINDLGEINLYQIPYHFLTGLKLVAPGYQQNNNIYTFLDNVEHPNPSLYKVKLPTTYNQQLATLILSQSYNEGWQAYAGVECRIMNNELCGLFAPVIGKKIGEHVLVNNWENGWQLELSTINHSPLTIYLVYLPQFLQYFGFFLIFSFFATFFWWRKLLD